MSYVFIGFTGTNIVAVLDETDQIKREYIVFPTI